MGKKAEDKILQKAKEKLGAAIEAVDPKAAGGVADLAKLCETLTRMKEVELKSEEGTFGSALTGD